MRRATQIASVSQTPTRWLSVLKMFYTKASGVQGGYWHLKTSRLAPPMEKATTVIKTCSLYCLQSSCLILPLDPDLTMLTEMLSVKKESRDDGRVATQQGLD